MSYNRLDDVPFSIRTGAAPQPAVEVTELTPENIFPAQFSDADFEGDIDASDLGAQHTPVPGPAQKQRFCDQILRHILSPLPMFALGE